MGRGKVECMGCTIAAPDDDASDCLAVGAFGDQLCPPAIGTVRGEATIGVWVWSLGLVSEAHTESVLLLSSSCTVGLGGW